MEIWTYVETFMSCFRSKSKKFNDKARIFLWGILERFQGKSIEKTLQRGLHRGKLFFKSTKFKGNKLKG